MLPIELPIPKNPSPNDSVLLLTAPLEMDLVFLPFPLSFLLFSKSADKKYKEVQNEIEERELR